ncbi:RNA-binding protein S4 [Iodidimonas gelatinilytica]|uniref:RNA-binding protein S4 n=1 Tax=Iodidimonas gelatinilytica TaxID=1236966 RepID=A0A5A7MP31_9PROT|nr:RNA-binding S4 domain-containing protein [Iodidimonas gelatinilytica]GEQ97750.1 RNA-binding protein S4 [Iodidimonas gelatinilytica]
MSKDGPTKDGVETARMRLDKWLWAARFYKTRSLATREVKTGRLRINGTHVKKPSAAIVVGDVLTFAKAERVFVVRVLALSDQRGPAIVAQGLYEDLSPPPESAKTAQEKNRHARREAGSGRPTKADRRALDRFLSQKE